MLARAQTPTHTVVLLLHILKVLVSNLCPVTSYACDDILELSNSLQGSFGTVHFIRPGLSTQPLSSFFDTMRFETLTVALNRTLSTK